VKSGLRFIILLGMAAAVACGVPSASDPGSIREQVKQATQKFHDLTGTAVPVYVNQKELVKVGKSLVRSHEIKRARLSFKDPDKFRMEGTLGLINIQYITSGDCRIVRMPGLHYTKREDASDDRDMCQSCLDVGILTDSMWDSFRVTYMDTETTPSGAVYVFKLTQPDYTLQKHQKIWVDAKTFRLLKREKFGHTGKLRVRLIYTDHKLVDGVLSVPSRTETYTPEGKLAAISELRDIKVNVGLPDSLFK
jgi:outer membrane lipoprotein-sorting protein